MAKLDRLKDETSGIGLHIFRKEAGEHNKAFLLTLI